LPTSSIQVPYFASTSVSRSVSLALSRAPLSSVPKLSLLPDAFSIPVQGSASSVLPSVCYLDTHRSTVSLFFNQSYLFSMGPEATFKGSIKALSVKYWKILFDEAVVTDQSPPLVTSKLSNSSTNFSCPSFSALVGVSYFFASSECTGCGSGPICPVIQYQMIG